MHETEVVEIGISHSIEIRDGVGRKGWWRRAVTDRIVVTMACGCRIEWSGGADAPYCAEHDQSQVRRTSAPPPRIIARNCGTADMGPLVLVIKE